MHVYKLVAAALLMWGCTPSSENLPEDVKQNDWLLAAEDEGVRDRLIQKQFRGFDNAMWEVGERYSRMHEALQRNNTELAAYHWEKIRTAVENGIARRPGRRANAEQFLLQGLWAEVDQDLRSTEIKRAWLGFERARSACQGCHHAEDVAYMNDQLLFDLAAPQGMVR